MQHDKTPLKHNKNLSDTIKHHSSVIKLNKAKTDLF